uniref:Uncharacterized protein n=1 Tax=Knipowitschia caucasica TaxID=637954 RepID=A0AAV2KGA0_KNICA
MESKSSYVESVVKPDSEVAALRGIGTGTHLHIYTDLCDLSRGPCVRRESKLWLHGNSNKEPGENAFMGRDFDSSSLLLA